jgi:hypothetical protein
MMATFCAPSDDYLSDEKSLQMLRNADKRSTNLFYLPLFNALQEKSL